MTANNPGPTNVPAPRPASAAAPMVSARAQLECLTGPEKGKKFRVAPGTTTIGRDPSCDVSLTETPISRQHARIDRAADGWVLKNLSANGTRLNKKTVDEAPLADGDVIGVGAKTRLRFDLETVTLSASGRPQFRARVAGEEKDKDSEAAAEEGPPLSLFQRRKKLFISLGVYAFALILLAAYLAVKGPSLINTPRPPPVLTRVDMIRLTPGANPVRIVNETNDGIMVEDDFGQMRFYSMAELQALGAEKIPGIQNALTSFHLDPANQANPTQASMYVAQAEELFTKRQQEPANLYKCVRTFHMALAALRGVPYLPDAKSDQLRRTAEKELVDKVDTEYNRAVLEEKVGHDERAIAIYNSILNMVPDNDNAVSKNIDLRKGVILQRNPKIRAVPTNPK